MTAFARGGSHRAPRRGASSLVLALALAGGASGCASDSIIGRGFESNQTLLVDVSVNVSFVGTSRYVLIYTPRDRWGTLHFGGVDRRASRRVPVERVAEIRRYLEARTLKLETVPRVCEDCTTYEIVSRVGPLVRFYAVEGTEGVPEEVAGLLELLDLPHRGG